MFDRRKSIIFGSCIWQTIVQSDAYDKKTLLDDINYNYEKNPRRNNFSKHNLHQLYNDWDNKNYRLPNFEKAGLYLIYKKIIEEFFQDTGVLTGPYGFEIVNYTVINNEQEMYRHSHIEKSDFSFVHYISYDSDYHYPLVFHNESPAQKFLNSRIISRRLDANSLEHSKYLPDWTPEIVEDTLIIFPSDLEHSVKNVFNVTEKPRKNRICIVGNILVE